MRISLLLNIYDLRLEEKNYDTTFFFFCLFCTIMAQAEVRRNFNSNQTRKWAQAQNIQIVNHGGKQ